MTFHVGQKVVVVMANVDRSYFTPSGLLKRGEIYTIRDIDNSCAHLHRDVPTIRLEEIRRPINMTIIGSWEQGFHPASFRPIVSKTTSIEIFRKLLAPTGKRKARQSA